jgi:hypothetical protein
MIPAQAGAYRPFAEAKHASYDRIFQTPSFENILSQFAAD